MKPRARRMRCLFFVDAFSQPSSCLAMSAQQCSQESSLASQRQDGRRVLDSASSLAEAGPAPGPSQATTLEMGGHSPRSMFSPSVPVPSVDEDGFEDSQDVGEPILAQPDQAMSLSQASHVETVVQPSKPNSL